MNTILLYYKYVPIADPVAFMASHKALCEHLGFKGRIIVSKEGINGTFEGTSAAVDEYIHLMRTDPELAPLFADTHFKKSTGTPDGTAFKRLSIKVRPEIVSGHLHEKDSATGDVNPNEVTGKRLSPETLHQWFKEGRKFEIVDMRNDYEHESGHFRGSILPPLSNFRDLPLAAAQLEQRGLKEKTVLTVCTGGVRCEKASGYLVKKGFKDVYQLDGGIVSYMEKYPGQDFLGSLYVFDGRVTMDFVPPEARATKTIVGRCKLCSSPSEHYVNCGNVLCHMHFICCLDCVSKAEAKGDEALCKNCLTLQIPQAHVPSSSGQL